MLAGRVEHGLSVGRVGFKDAGVERSMRTADDDRRGLAPSDQIVLFGGQRPVVGSHEDIRVHGGLACQSHRPWVFQIAGEQDPSLCELDQNAKAFGIVADVLLLSCRWFQWIDRCEAILVGVFEVGAGGPSLDSNPEFFCFGKERLDVSVRMLEDITGGDQATDSEAFDEAFHGIVVV